MTTDALAATGRTLLADAPGRARPGRLRRLLRGDAADPGWGRPALLGLLAATAVLYLWGLGASGWANSFYSAAAQAGSASWKAMFFGSSDAANSITVDKPPAALWIMALSVRIFGLSSWSVLVPQALEGVASVGLLYATVRRTSGIGAGLLAGAVLALTPVAALMFRFNNPDSLLVLLMIGGAYCVLRAIEDGSTRWLALAGVLTGFGFLTKMLQSLLVVPAFALAYLIAAPNPIRRRIWQLLAAGAALIASAGWWIAIVSLVPARDRPYIGGSQHNSILELTLGYNGFGRLTGDETGSVGGGGGGGNGGGMWGATGWNRLFGSDMGAQISWLLPSALLLLVAGLWWTRRARRTDRARAALIVWGGWLIVTGLVFSYAQGIIHPYYTVALAPAIAALVGIGAMLLWRARHEFAAVLTLAVTLLCTVVWQFELLGRTPNWLPWLRYAVLVVGLFAALTLLIVSQLARRTAAALGALALVCGLAAPAAYAVSTARSPHSGSIPTAGPSGVTGMGGPGGGFGGGGRPGGGGAAVGGFGQGGMGPAGTGPGGTGRAGTGRAGTGQAGTGQAGMGPAGTGPGGATGLGGTTGGGGFGGGAGGLLDSSTPSAAVIAALSKDASSYTWVAAAVGSNSAAGFQLATQRPVMAVGGFNGSDPSPTLAQFKADVASGKIHYFIASGGGFGAQMGGSQAALKIASWVEANFTSSTVGGVTLYDLTATASGGD